MDQPESTAANPVRRSRRWFQFSLRGFLVVLTIGCLWLGWKVDQAHKQADAVRAIEALGGVVRYDWQTRRRISFKVDQWSHRFDSHFGGPPWMHNLLQKAVEVYFFRPMPTSEGVARGSIRYLKQLRWLRQVHMATSKQAESELRAALPACEVSSALFYIDPALSNSNGSTAP